MEPDCIALWEPPPEDHAAWQGLTGEAMTHEEYLTLLAAVQADQERQGRTVRRACFSVARMRGELFARGWSNDPADREGWKQLEDHRGSRFLSYELFCREPRPFGLGYDLSDIDRIIREREEQQVADRAKGAKPPAKSGRPGKGTNQVPLSKGGNDRITMRRERRVCRGNTALQ